MSEMKVFIRMPAVISAQMLRRRADGVYCTWTVDDEECFEVYNPKDLAVVWREGA